MIVHLIFCRNDDWACPEKNVSLSHKNGENISIYMSIPRFKHVDLGTYTFMKITRGTKVIPLKGPFS